VPTASDKVQFAVTGPARFAGVGNGDPTCHEPDRASERSLFNGMAQAILQSTGGASDVVLTATATGLESATLRLAPKLAAPRPAVAIAQRRWLVTDWRVSPRGAVGVDALAAQDMNSWERIKLTRGHLAILPGEAGPVTYLARLKLPKRLQQHRARLVLHGLCGEAEISVAGSPISRLMRPGVAQLPAVPAEGADLAIQITPDEYGAGLTGLVELVPADAD
jgi:beta-galactosidase